ncbi:hypothetical protein E8E14_012880, partial [Neopestalotiopsis sp. 37M]
MDSKTSTAITASEKSESNYRPQNHEPENSQASHKSIETEIKGNEKDNKAQLFLLLSCLFCGVFVMALDATIIGTAVPSITTDFKSLDDIAWYGSGYLLTITAFQPTFGKIYQFMNIKAVFMACVMIFE